VLARDVPRSVKVRDCVRVVRKEDGPRGYLVAFFRSASRSSRSFGTSGVYSFAS
jgi:hypothetical protein